MSSIPLTERVEVLITVKAAPEIGRIHGETVCVAGLRLGLLAPPTWIRLFPVRWQWFSDNEVHKYDVVELDVSKHDGDPRPESYRPKLGTLRVAGHARAWKARDEIIAQVPRHTMCELVAAKGWDRPSLAIVRPSEVLAFDWESTADSVEHRERQMRALQGDLLDQSRPSLEFCPFTFRFRYRCEAAGCPGRHHQSIIDWELSEAWRKWSRDYPDNFLDRIKSKWLTELCDARRGPEFFVGNQKNAPQAFMVLGIYPSGTPLGAKASLPPSCFVTAPGRSRAEDPTPARPP